MTVTNAAADAREAVAARREQLDEVLRRYGASNPRLFGSVARGDATTDSDIDVLVDLDPAGQGRRDRPERCRGPVARSVDEPVRRPRP